MRSVLKSSLVVAVALLMVSATAEAGRRHHSCGSYGSCGSSGGSCGSWGSYGSCGSSGGSCGSHGSCGSSGGSCGSSGGSCGSWGSYGSCGSSGGHVVHYHAAVTPVQPAEMRATLELQVPSNAVVYLMNQKMTITGEVRRFTVPLTSTDRVYDYQVRVEVLENGKTSEASTSLKIKAGANVKLNVMKDAAQQMLTVAQL